MKRVKKSLFMLFWIVFIVLAKTHWASLFLSWNEEVVKNCPTEIEIRIDTEDKEVNSAWVNLILNDNFIVNNVDSKIWVLRSYATPKKLKARIWEFENKEYLRLLWTTNSPNNFEWKWIFSKITITPKNDFTLEFYAIPWYEWEDSNLSTKDNWKVIDILWSVENKKFNIVDWECKYESLEEIKFEEPKTLISTEEITTKTEKSITTNKENIFDRSQETNFFKKNRVYLIIWTIIIFLVSLLLKKKKK